ncbi:hypothetical protein BLNAU_8215 [Blattamonas nauphoetae]|uniref:Uncharacterized protein n=1 Tax=Blattamonas nauphoetae TaxID=2049346 RepID=A0ABQ9XZ36_9EUKA|nr:hypothetical protein BLNAU_8215 [Blattamonas nauphoetae]
MMCSGRTEHQNLRTEDRGLVRFSSPSTPCDLVLLLTLRIPLFLSMFFPSAVHRVLLSNLQTHHYNILLRLSEHGIPRTLRSALLQLRHVRRAHPPQLLLERPNTPF